jgi:protein-tyrosine-phosphatase
VQVCLENSIDISEHRSRPLIGEEIRDSELILCMEKGHAQFAKTFFPWHRDRIFLLGAWPGKEKRKSVVEDPVGAPIEVFRHVFGIITTHIDRVLQHL